MLKQTKTALNRLKLLATDGDKNIFERITLAASVVSDDQYLVEFHGGDQDKAMEVLEADYFRALSGYIRLHILLAIYRAFPDEAKWQEYRYDLRAMELLWREQRKAAATDEVEVKPAHKRATVAELEEIKHHADEVQYQLKREREAASARDAELAAARARVRELEHEVAELTGRLKAYESMRNLVAA